MLAEQRRRSGAHPRDVAKYARFQFLFVEAVFHQIADTDDALQLVALDHREVTDSRCRHRRKHGIDAIGGAAGEDRRRHQLLDLNAEHGGAVTGYRLDEVPLREDADRFHPPVLHDQRTDAMLSQLADRKLDAIGGVYPLNVMALGPQNIGNKHGCLLQSGARPRALSRRPLLASGFPVSRWGFGAALPKGGSIVGRKSDSVLRQSPADCAALIRPTEGGPAMPFYEKGDVRIHYEEVGSGFPLIVIPGGGLNSTVAGLANHPFNPMEEFKGEYRVIAADLRNANGGQSAGPLEIERPWDAYTDDHIGLMDHLGIREFMVLGFCIGGPFIWNLLKRAPGRVVAAVLAQPSGFRPAMPELFYHDKIKGWGPGLCERRPDVTMDRVDAFLNKMYRSNADFVFTVTRDFVRNSQTPILVLPDDVPAHPYAVAMESVHLAPNAQVSLYPWKDTPDKIPLAVRHIRTFLRAHRPVAAAHQPMAAAAQ